MKYSLRSLPPFSPPTGADGIPDRPRRRIQLSLLGLFAVVTILCFALAGYAFYSETERKVKEGLVEAIRKMADSLKNSPSEVAP
jgi:hypothetical protein